MVRLFKHYVPHSVLILGIVEFIVLLLVAEAAWVLRASQIGIDAGGLAVRLAPLFTFAAVVHGTMIAVGLYNPESLRSVRYAAARIIVAVSIAIIFLSVIRFVWPDPVLWRSITLYAMLMAMAVLILIRAVVIQVIDVKRFRRPVMLLGAGTRAQRLVDLADTPNAGFCIVGSIAMTTNAPVVADAVPRSSIAHLADYAAARGTRELVLALEERRGSLPLNDLLRAKTLGLDVNEFSSFIERETGRIDLATTNPSWLIFSDGFSAPQRLSRAFKRVFDIVASLIVLVLVWPLIVIGALAVKLDSKGPAFYRQTRVGLFGEPYEIVKLRSMRIDAEVAGTAVWAEENDPRVTRVGRIIRKIRVDELPQLWCVLKGEMSVVGPRPERPSFVEQLQQDIPFYAERHMVKPGLTGWAQINYPYGASVEDARAKLEYDLYYAKNYSPFLDLLILMQTVQVVIWPSGAR